MASSRLASCGGQRLWYHLPDATNQSPRGNLHVNKYIHVTKIPPKNTKSLCTTDQLHCVSH